jgi:hypothetical protein
MKRARASQRAARRCLTCRNALRHLIASSFSTTSLFSSFQKYDTKRFKSSAFTTPAAARARENACTTANPIHRRFVTCGAQHGGCLHVSGALVSRHLLHQALHLQRE